MLKDNGIESVMHFAAYAFVNESVTDPAKYYQNIPTMARLLAEWGDRPAGVLALLPMWHPVLLAEQIGTLAAFLLYLRQFPEYQRSFPAARPGLLRASYGDELPEAGYFGFPHRDGWKAVAELYRAGALQGSYDTNQNRWLAGWYLGGLASQCKGAPDLYLIAEAEPTVYFPPGYHLVAEVLAGPARAIAVYGRAPAPGGPVAYELADTYGQFAKIHLCQNGMVR